MKTQRLLLMLIFVSVFGVAGSVDAQKVHALLITLGNDRQIQESVEQNQENMVNMLKQLSYHCDVQLTLMHSQSAHEGIVSHKTLVKGRSENPTTAEQDIITSRQVAEWVVNLQPTAEDTVLIYYNGHGVIGAFDTHYLLFDPGVSGDSLDRGTLSQKLRGQSARLRLLITDTCSNVSEDLSDDIYAKYATIRPQKIPSIYARPFLRT